MKSKLAVSGKEQGRTARAIATGESRLDAGDYAAAALTAEEVLRRDSNHLGALELLARVRWRSGQYELGLDTLRHLIRLNPYEPGYQFMAGGAHQALGHYGEAVLAYCRCLDSENETLRKSAAVAIRELESWQETVIADMLRTDRSFQAEYAASPLEACRKRGFVFSGESHSTALMLAANPTPAVVWERPS